MASLKVGNPMDPQTNVGPLATAEGVNDLEKQVSKSVAMGARVLLGGKRLNQPGNFFAPTVLTDIPEQSPARVEEMFGPVASLFRVRDMAHALEIANETDFGLGSCAWTNDEHEREMFITEIDAGMAFINGMVASDPRLPFGGVRHSGYGRELSHFGIREFVNIKTVAIYETSSNNGGGSAIE
jgi:succinate-semialdehyde dehydrogenase/glutarate-semialdehyde dehydrogenase